MHKKATQHWMWIFFFFFKNEATITQKQTTAVSSYRYPLEQTVPSYACASGTPMYLGAFFYCSFILSVREVVQQLGLSCFCCYTFFLYGDWSFPQFSLLARRVGTGCMVCMWWLQLWTTESPVYSLKIVLLGLKVWSTASIFKYYNIRSFPFQVASKEYVSESVSFMYIFICLLPISI